MLKNESIRDMPKHELAALILEEDPTMNENHAHYLAGKLKRKTQRRDLGFYEGLRILGLVTDETPMLAVRNMERQAAA